VVHLLKYIHSGFWNIQKQPDNNEQTTYLKCSSKFKLYFKLRYFPG